MRVAIIGTGGVGSTLGSTLAESGHEVVFGSRDPGDAKVETLVETAGENVRVTGQSEAAVAGEAVVLAVPGSVAPDVAGAVADELAGKPLLDTTNRMDRNGESLASAIADAAPDADVVKAFNTIGTDGMARPEFADGRATMFLAGDDEAAKGVAATLARDVGFEVVDAGDLAAAVMLEDLARLWIHLSRRYGRDIGFKLLRN